MNDQVDTVVEAPESGSGEQQNAAASSGAENTTANLAGEINLDALMDVEVSLSVEIGRTRLPIKELLSLNQGSVIELDREFNEPLDLMVNGMLVARGEVVVVDGQFGLRLIDIVSQPERLQNLK